MTALDRLAPPLFIFIWATGYIVAKLAAPYADPLTFLCWRYAGVVALMLGLALAAAASSQGGVLHPAARRRAAAAAAATSGRRRFIRGVPVGGGGTAVGCSEGRKITPPAPVRSGIGALGAGGFRAQGGKAQTL